MSQENPKSKSSSNPVDEPAKSDASSTSPTSSHDKLSASSEGNPEKEGALQKESAKEALAEEGAEDELSDRAKAKRRQRRFFRFRDRFLRKDKTAPRKRRYRLQPKPPTDFRRELTTIPNILTYIRMAVLPLMLLVLDRDSRWTSFVAGMIFAGACFTDFFDGYFARKFNQITVLGKLLDPLADKLIVSATLIVMIPMGRIPSWLVIVLLAREFAITGLRGIAASESMVIAAAPLAKFKTAFQMVALFCLLIHYPYRIDYFSMFSLEVNFHRIGMVLLYIALFFSITSAFDYFWKFATAIQRSYEEAKAPSAE